MPKFSIANDFFISRLEKKLRGLTLPERFMTQLVSIVALTRVMRGGRHRCIRSHCIAFDSSPGHLFCYYRDPLRMWLHSELFWLVNLHHLNRRNSERCTEYVT
ncbi:hypothetical protein GQ600_26894 [Phytophthora cactorum]|nr:hypothetical protein GQ600_26894 [Phytophthora cactorum]